MKGIIILLLGICIGLVCGCCSTRQDGQKEKEVKDVINKYIRACLTRDYELEHSVVELLPVIAIGIAGIDMYKSEDAYEKYMSSNKTREWCSFLKESTIKGIEMGGNTAVVLLKSPKTHLGKHKHNIVLSKNGGGWCIIDFTTRRPLFPNE